MGVRHLASGAVHLRGAPSASTSTGELIMSNAWTQEKVAFVDGLKAIDHSLGIWAEVKLDGGEETLGNMRDKLRRAYRLVQHDKEAL
jgi:hypothetical protein